MASTLPSHLQVALEGVVDLMQCGASGEAVGNDDTARYSDLLQVHRTAAVFYLAALMEWKTNGSFSVRQANYSLFRDRVSFNRTPVLCLAVCRPTRRHAEVVELLGDTDELYFIPRRTEPSTGLMIRKVERF